MLPEINVMDGLPRYMLTTLRRSTRGAVLSCNLRVVNAADRPEIQSADSQSRQSSTYFLTKILRAVSSVIRSWPRVSFSISNHERVLT